MKKILLTIALIPAFAGVYAQSTNSGATQAVNLAMNDVIEIAIVSGNTLNMGFSSVNDYANGVVSAEQELVVKSNKNFNVRVKAQTSRFSYSGASSDPKMPASKLSVKVTANNTGGVISSGHTTYKSLSTGGRSMISNATAGGNNNFKVQYKATPGYTYPAGVYTVDVVYTATQS